MSSAADADALAQLYASLGDDDLYRRFFQAHVPTARTIQRILTTADRGGVGLVAVLDEADGAVRLVGETSCEPLPGGGADLGITVAPQSRGWLGPYLLDALIETARAQGITNLQADVLVENRRMLALARARGYATVDHSERPSIVRVVMGTAGRTPPWPGPHLAPRVLVEAPGGRWHGESAVRAAGFEVMVCPGPVAHRQCPALAGEPCPLASNADLVIDTVPPDSTAGRALLDAHDHLHAGVPICVEFPADAPTTGNRPTIPRRTDDAAVVSLIQRLVARPAEPADAEPDST
jgi:ribosomal protein S18 acetylase RimI-like enzyme